MVFITHLLDITKWKILPLNIWAHVLHRGYRVGVSWFSIQLQRKTIFLDGRILQYKKNDIVKCSGYNQNHL